MEKKCTEVVRMLLEVPGIMIINEGKSGGRTALHWSVYGPPEIVRLLVSFGGGERVDVNVKDDRSRTPLHWAARSGRVESVQQLLAVAGIDVNAVDKKRRTPLHCAVWNLHSEVVWRLLTVRGVDVQRTDNRGMVPLQSLLSRSLDPRFFVAAWKSRQSTLLPLCRAAARIGQVVPSRWGGLKLYCGAAVEMSADEDALREQNSGVGRCAWWSNAQVLAFLRKEQQCLGGVVGAQTTCLDDDDARGCYHYLHLVPGRSKITENHRSPGGDEP